MNKSYAAARKYADHSGIKIYNATRGGHLEVFERINLMKSFVIPKNTHLQKL